MANETKENNFNGLDLRRTHIDKIENFITSRIKSRTSGLLYLSGPPGTGKTMSVNCALQKLKPLPENKTVKIVQMNCNKLSKSKVVLAQLCKEIGIEKKIKSKSTETDMIATIEHAIVGRTATTHILVLDEIDQIPNSRNSDLFNRFFRFPLLEKSKLILIGISNCTSITAGLRFKEDIVKISFRPYTKKEIRQIVEYYISTDLANTHISFDPMTIDLISKRVAKENGDIRQAINSYRSVIEDQKIRDESTGQEALIGRAVYASTWNRRGIKRSSPVKTSKSRKTQLKEIDNLELTDSILETPPPSPKPTRASAATFMNSAIKRSKRTLLKGDRISFFHQAVLCSLRHLMNEKPKSNSQVDFKASYSFFKRAAEKLSISLTEQEYKQCLEHLEVEGLISIKKILMKTRVSLKVPPEFFDDHLEHKNKIEEALGIVKVSQ